MDASKPPRHGCLTAYLVFMMIANTLTCLGYFFAGDKILAQLPSAPAWTPAVMGVGALINVALALALFWWKKWAFYGFCVMAVLCFVLNLTVLHGSLASVVGLLGPILLYGVLQIGGERKGWNFLR